MGELTQITVSTFTTRSPNNTSLANRTSTSVNPNRVIIPAFVEANYEVLESLLKDHRRHVRNENLHTESEYYSEEYDEDKEMEPRPVRVREATPGSRAEREFDGRRPSERRTEEGGSHGGNLPPLLAVHLGRSENGQPLQSTLTSGYNGHMYPLSVPSTRYPFYAQPINPLPNANMYQTHHPGGLFVDSTSCVTPFVRCIEDYPLLDGLKMPLHPTTCLPILLKISPGYGRTDKKQNGYKDIVPAEASILKVLINLPIRSSVEFEYHVDKSTGCTWIVEAWFSGEHLWPLGEKHGLASEQNEAAYKEVDELTKAWILREVKYWTDRLEDGIALWVPNHMFLDAYKGYHQIQMAEEDEDKTTFFTRKGVFCYQKMPFGLKNARETYQGPFLGHLITKQGIKANPSKFKAITDLKPLKTFKEIHSLNGKLAALSRFLSKGADVFQKI
ncbi:hypothetical protein Tco_0469019 [Tanacetum coccineum]